MSKLTPLIFAFIALSLLPGCEQLAQINMGQGGNSKSPEIKTDKNSPQTEAKPVKPVFVYNYSYEGNVIQSGQVIAVNAPDKEFPEGSVTLEIFQNGMPEPVYTRMDPRAWKIIKPSSPVKVLPSPGAEVVPAPEN